MKFELCTHGSNAPHSLIKNLHPAQGGSGRHKCPVCAYRLGFEAGISKRLGIADTADENKTEQCFKGSSASTSFLKRLPYSQAGTGRHKCPVCAYEQGYDNSLAQPQIEPQDIPLDVAINLKAFPDVDDENLSVREGRSRWVQHFRRERNAKIVNTKKVQVLKATGNLKCEACGFDFKERYGSLGDGFCEAHHKQPLSTLNEQTETRLEDLAILCSNCHRMIHHTKPIMRIAEFKKFLATISDS